MFRSAWLWSFIFLLLLVAIALVGMPYALRYGIEQWFYAHNATDVTIGEMESNPFKGTVHIRQLEVEGDDGDILSADDLRLRFLWQSLWRHRLKFDTVTLHGANLRFDKPAIASLRRSRDRDWPVEIGNLRLSDVELLLPVGAQRIPWRIREGTLSPWSSNAQDRSSVMLEGDFAGAPLRLHGTFKLAADVPEGEGEIELDNLDLARIAQVAPALRELHGLAVARLRLRLLRDVQDHVQLANEGTIRVHDLRVAGEDAKLESGESVWAGEGELQLTGSGAGFHQQGQWKSTQLQLTIPGGTVRTDSTEWHGRLDAKVHLGRPPTVSADGALEMQSVALHRTRTDLSVQTRRVQWQGVLSEGALDVPGGVSAAGQLQLFDLHVQRPKRQIALLDATQASLRDLDMKGTYSVTARSLELMHYRVDVPTPHTRAPLAHGESALFEQLALTGPQRFSAERLELGDFHLLLRKQADGQWLGVGLPAQSSAATSGSDTYWRIDRVVVENGNNTLQFEDQSVQPSFARTIKLQHFSLAELDSAEPLRLSPMALQGAIGDGTRIVAVGKLRPFAEHLNLALKTKIYSLPLAPLSPYSRKHLGIEINAGKLDVESTLHVIDGALRSDNQLVSRGMRMRASGEPSSAVREQLGMPVPVALALLRAPDQVQRVEMPLRGDLEAPDFDLGLAFEQALSSTLRDAALSTVRNTLQPFGIAEAGNSVLNGTGLLLEPLLFRAGSTELNPVTETYLRRLAALLQQRPAVRLQICAITTENDRAAANAASTLTQNRTTAVMNVLTRNYGIGQERLQSCARNATTDTGRPRAELRLQ